jgi:hypothetical protein
MEFWFNQKLFLFRNGSFARNRQSSWGNGLDVSMSCKILWCFQLYTNHILLPCRVFHLKRNSNWNSICKLWWHQYNKTNFFFKLFIHYEDLTEQLYRWCLPPSQRHANTSCVLKLCYQSVYFCLICYLLARIRIAKCFMNSSRWFWCEVMFENEYTLCLWIHHFHSFYATGMISSLATKLTLTQVSQGSLGESVTWGWACFWFHFIT